MKRQNRGLDLSIQGDELERHRIELETNLQNTDISLRLSAPSEDEYGDVPSVEYPRHNSGPGFPSFEIPSRDHYDGDSQSGIHPWAYRANDDEGINPYAPGESVSTAAHHASALTLSAGLGGGRTGRRDVSLSGAEYDPDRPLKDLMAGVDPKMSIFDIEPSRSRYAGNPLVVDSTAELDQILQTGHVPPLGSPLQSSSSSSASSAPGVSNAAPSTSRPKLTDALRRVSFSPQRPRSNPNSPRIPARHLPNINQTEATPRPIKKKNDVLHANQPQVRLQPPTPTNTSFVSQSQSQFSKLARGLTREIQNAQRNEAAIKQAERNLFDAGRAPVKSQQQQTPVRPSALKQRSATPAPNAKSKIHLPDVTGLTSAVESPMKLGSEYYMYPGSPRENQARLITLVNTVQSKLQHLEEENGISRRRVRELELELEVCKRDVARERTRVLEREELIVQQQRDASFTAASRRKEKGKARARDISMDQDGLHQKYREAVEGQKALEALITTLRTHLTRLTAELSSHRTLLMDLRELRDVDVRTLKAKSAEVERLSKEVERLGGEVEVLRSVVEEGLRERRGNREAEEVLDRTNVGMSLDRDEEEEEREVEVEEAEEEEEEETPEPFDPVGIAESSRNAGERATAMRSTNAIFGSPNPVQRLPPAPVQTTMVQFMDSAEFERISAEIEERRSIELIARSPRAERSQAHRPTVEDASDDEEQEHRREYARRSMSPSPQPRPSTSAANHHQNPPTHHSQNTKRRQQNVNSKHQNSRQAADETPFPQIRGGHLERLFFSAPEHNAQTCAVCCRRRQVRGENPSWMPTRFRDAHKDAEAERLAEDSGEDEGFADEEEEGGVTRGAEEPNGNHNHWRLRAQKEGLPPQTVVARVIRELEDDFTHYKGIYVELAEQYKDMDPVSDVPRRNLLAQHLREVVDVLEQKGDQIAALYDLLTFKDKPVQESIVPFSNPTTVPGQARVKRTVSTTAAPSTSIGRTAGAAIKRQHTPFA
ncbi:hypothetical protein H0H92_004341 [Tricholoma furcatifolium]|nr:hypothetical protein H0H92_004341 [Tricholoma furcatifolium]